MLFISITLCWTWNLWVIECKNVAQNWHFFLSSNPHKWLYLCEIGKMFCVCFLLWIFALGDSILLLLDSYLFFLHVLSPQYWSTNHKCVVNYFCTSISHNYHYSWHLSFACLSTDYFAINWRCTTFVCWFCTLCSLFIVHGICPGNIFLSLSFISYSYSRTAQILARTY